MRIPIIAALLACGMVSSSAGQTAEDWRKMHRMGDNRYEGVGFRTQQSSPAIVEIVSFVAFKDEPADRGPVELAIDFFSRRASIDCMLARELNPIKYYRMEAIPPPGGWRTGWNRFAGWSTGDVLDPEKITLSKVGVLVMLEPDDGRRKDAPCRDDARVEYVAPAVLRRKDAKIPSAFANYQVHFVSTVSMSGGRYEVFSGCGSAAGEPLKAGQIGTQRANIAFPVSVPLKEAAPGWYRLKIDLTPTGSQVQPAGGTSGTPPVSREYCFPHQPPPRGD